MAGLTLGLGTVVVAGRSYHITQLELAGGEIVISAERYGEAPELTGEPITVFGQDGRGVFQGGAIDIERARRPDRTEMTVRLRLTWVD